MKVLMFGWEFPPKIYGGLAVASYGITKGLSLQGDVETTFCMPKPTGEEEDFLKIVGMNQVPIVWRDVDYNYLKSRLTRNMTPEDYYSFRDHIYSDFSYMHVNDIGCMDFAGGYPGNLHEEINNFSVIAGVVARQQEFDIIHAHDWLTYPAGVHAKMVSGKPLCIHVHATDFDRSRGKVNPTVYSMEKNGMDYADCIMCVSELTRRTVIEQYHQNPKKVFALHNAVYPLSQEYQDIPRPDHSKEKIVTFLGRITMQKGPEYFVEAASLVLQRARNIRFVMAGSGDMMDAMINLAAERGIADRFHFTGFLRGEDVHKMFQLSDVYVMPSVSEPFGISPLEAMRSNVPVIISKQSGVAEVLDFAVKVDYWDVDALADDIYGLIQYPALSGPFASKGLEEVTNLKWNDAAAKIKAVYEAVIEENKKQ